MTFADLHLHTNFSDGTLTCEELVSRAAGAGLSAISIVDHDTVAGFSSASAAGDKHGVEVIPGVELTAEENNAEIHILGYFIDCGCRPLLEKLEFLRKNRVERIYKICEKLKKEFGVDLDPQSVFDLAPNGTVGRLHVARAMVKAKIAVSTAEAFYRFIGDRCPGYVAGFKLSPQEAITSIKSAGGIPVLAHPYTLKRDELIPEFVKMGLMGLEVYYTEHSQGMVNFYLGLVKKYNLLATGGSDFHGDAKPEVSLGIIKIPYTLVEKLKEAREPAH